MKQALQSPWFTVCLAIAVLTVGYVVHLQQNGSLAAEHLYQCPMEEMCKKAGCHSEGSCSRDECGSCPFCMKEAS